MDFLKKEIWRLALSLVQNDDENYSSKITKPYLSMRFVRLYQAPGKKTETANIFVFLKFSKKDTLFLHSFYM